MITVKISGTEYRADTRISIRQQAGSLSTSNIDVLVDDGAIPGPLEKVIISNDGTPIFLGFIESAETPTFSSGEEVKLWRLSVYSANKLFDFRLVNNSWQGKYTHEIVSDIFSEYIETEGITLGEISTTEYYHEVYSISYMKVADVLAELAETLDAIYTIDENGKFYFLVRDSIDMYDAPEHLTALKEMKRTGEVRTEQIVLGATEETSTQNFSEIWDSDQSIITVGYQISAIDGITINGTPAGVGIIGLDEADTSKTFLYSVGSQVITVNNSASVKPTTSDIVAGVYKGYYDIIVISENEELKTQIAALNSTSGKIEHVLTDETIENYSDASNLSGALLDKYSEFESEVTCKTLGLDYTGLYTGWRLAYDDLGIVGDYVITERNIEDFGEELLISLKLKNKGLFSRYGTVLKTRDKNKQREIIVYRQSFISNDLMIRDKVFANDYGMMYFPSSGTDLIDPFIGDVYFSCK